jgi:hypothetical protein
VAVRREEISTGGQVSSRPRYTGGEEGAPVTVWNGHTIQVGTPRHLVQWHQDAQ